ncbi:MAG: hypothetical protein JSW28_07040 [Thermoplasmata archaeon]|nr:MAG: hypothetical protein JSW28_07040 [Thermoplasmata archaeon]
MEADDLSKMDRKMRMSRQPTISQRVITWGIWHVSELFKVIILTIVLGCMLLLIMAFFMFTLFIFVFIIIYMIVPLMLYGVYHPAKRYREVIDAISPELLDLYYNKGGILRFKTSSFGEFFLHYYSGDELVNPYYRIWIAAPKCGPYNGENNVILWEKPSRRNRDRNSLMDVPEFVPLDDVNEVPTLRRITLERYGKDFKIMAVLDDAWLHSETQDLFSVLQILEDIQARL